MPVDRARHHRPPLRQRASRSDGRDHWYHELVADQPADVSAGADGRRGSAVPAVHERHHRQAERHRAHDRRLPDAGRGDPPDDLRHPRRRRVLVRRRLRLGDRAHLHRLRAAREPHDGHDVRGGAGLARQGPMVVDHREVRATILYTAPTAIRAFMRWGTEFPEKHDLSSLRLLGSVGEPINPEAWIWYWNVHRRRALPRRRHLVADRDGRDHDHAAARADHAEAGFGDGARSRGSRRTSWTSGAIGGARRRGLPGAAASLAVDRRTIWGDPDRYVRDLLRRATGPRSTWRATARAATRTATSGCSAASTT